MKKSLYLASIVWVGFGLRAEAIADSPRPMEAPSFPGQWAPPAAPWKFPVWSKPCTKMANAEERAACLEFVAADWPRFTRFAEANAQLAAPKPNEKRVVFFGDSITDNWAGPQSGGFFPGKPFVNRGIGGQTTAQMLLRFRADVLALRPRVVVILAGTNDIAGNNGVATLAQIEDNLASMAELAKVNGVKVVLASVLPVTDEKVGPGGARLVQTGERPPQTIQSLNEWLGAYAKSHGHVYLNYHPLMADARGLLRPELTYDGLHPNAAGYAVMAPLAEQAISKAVASR